MEGVRGVSSLAETVVGLNPLLSASASVSNFHASGVSNGASSRSLATTFTVKKQVNTNTMTVVKRVRKRTCIFLENSSVS